MAKLPWLLFSIFLATQRSTFARTPDRRTQRPHDTDPVITFSMNDVLAVNRAPTSGPSIGSGGYLPFTDPNGLPPPKDGTHLLPPDAAIPGFSTRTAPSAGWLPFLASLQGLESGTVAVIDEELTGGIGLRPPALGTVKGIYVASWEDNSSLMVAMNAVVHTDGKSEGSLRLFGVHRPGLPESHVAVIGGTGRYSGANGFAVVKAVDLNDGGMKRKLMFSVYLK